ncbi:hypothetical protein ABZ128_32380 [Streptomyces sp. NPDC006326]|uniref:hypothetical protein n=1 Tax=Streptomyces sp. NPDC006326 TaxID=3156752 RepID=UPI0033BBD101
MHSDVLGIYLNDHVAGATAGLELARRVARSHRRSALGPELSRLVEEIDHDRRELLRLMEALRIPVRRHKVLAGWVSEKAGRVKLNGRLLRRSPLSSLLEFEALRLGAEGKACLWTALLPAASAERPALDESRLQHLLGRAREQISLLEDLRVRAAAGLFAGDRAPS